MRQLISPLLDYAQHHIVHLQTVENENISTKTINQTNKQTEHWFMHCFEVMKEKQFNSKSEQNYSENQGNNIRWSMEIRIGASSNQRQI